MKPQDILILLKLLSEQNWIYERLAKTLFMSQSEVHAGLKRAEASRLINLQISRQPIRRALLEFLIHGVKYAYPAKRGSIMRGIPTAYAAPPLSKYIVQSDALPPVWDYAKGQVKGYQLFPLYKSVPQAALHDKTLYEFLG